MICCGMALCCAREWASKSTRLKPDAKRAKPWWAKVVQIAQLVQIGQPLVREYLALYQAIDNPVVQARLQEQIDRLIRFEKKGGR